MVALVLEPAPGSVAALGQPALPAPPAQARGPLPEVLPLPVNAAPADGRPRAGLVTLDQLAVGRLVERAVPALIAHPGQVRASVLGRSFLNRVESWEVRGERLVLRGHERIDP